MGRIDDLKLDGFTIPELEALRERAAELIEAKREEVKRELREKMEKLAAQEGLTLSEVIATRAPKKSRAKAKAKYANPRNPSEVWAGRGKQPAWVKEALAAGKTLESLRVDA